MLNEQHKILAIDTSSEACSVALMIGETITQKIETTPRQHANLLLPMVQQLLTESDMTLNQLDLLACCVGPGAFTGLRIAVAAAQGLAFSAQIPVIGVSSLAALAQKGFDLTGQRQFACAIDARMSEVYFGGYRINSDNIAVLNEGLEECVIAPARLQERLVEDCDTENFVEIGSGWREYAEHLPEHGNKRLADAFVEAKYLFPIARKALADGLSVSAEQLQPVYLRNKVAEKSKK